MDILTDITARRAALAPDDTAFHVVETGETLSYAGLDRRSACAASPVSHAENGGAMCTSEQREKT